MQELVTALESMMAKKPLRFVISNPKNKSGEFRKIIVEYKQHYWQVSRYTQKQVFHENIDSDALLLLLNSSFVSFSQINAWSETEEMELKVSKKGKIFYQARRSRKRLAPSTEHNRKKKYLLTEGDVIPPLVDMGIFTADGQVVNSMYDKYRQINRFVEIIDDCLKGRDWRELRVIDFGFGKSYLTFILYYYLTEIKGIRVTMTGLDLKADVIENCNKTAARYGYEGLTFELGDIDGYQTESPVDMVVTLHACDTATDFALFNAVRWNAAMIFSVPCCQHEVNKQIESEAFSLLTKYGIIKERFSALTTDAIRGNLLECCGYSAQLMEFIDISHTPKNILIRAVRQSKKPANRKAAALNEVRSVMKEFNLQQTFYSLLEEDGRLEFESGS